MRQALENAEEHFERVEKPKLKREYLECRNDRDDNDIDIPILDEDTYSNDSEIEEYLSIFDGGPILFPLETTSKKEHDRFLFNQNSKQEKKYLKQG